MRDINTLYVCMYVCMYVFVPVLCCVADFFPCRFLYVTDVFQDALCDPGSSSFHLLVDIQRNACLASTVCHTRPPFFMEIYRQCIIARQHAMPASQSAITRVANPVRPMPVCVLCLND